MVYKSFLFLLLCLISCIARSIVSLPLSLLVWVLLCSVVASASVPSTLLSVPCHSSPMLHSRTRLVVFYVEQDALMSPNPSGKLEDLVTVVCVCLVV